MSKQNWTKENVTYEEWVMEINRFFFAKEWRIIESPYQTFFPMYQSGMQVSEAIHNGHLITDAVIENTTIAANLNFPVNGETEIALHKIIKTISIWQATITSNGNMIFVTDDQFTV